jgi:Flp pilus assembly protein TadD
MRRAVLSACLAALALVACDSRQPAAPEPTARVASAPLALPSAPPTGPALTRGLAPAAELPADALDALDEPLEEALELVHHHSHRVDHLGRAHRLQKEGDLSGALTETRRALYDEPESERALHTLIRLARRTKHPELALDAWSRLAWLQPEDPVPLIQQARLLLDLGDTPGARLTAEAALELDPEHPEPYHLLGRVHLIRGELAEARLRFQQALHLDPYHGYALNNLGLVYLRTGEDTQAAEVLAQAAYLLPDEAFVHNNLGQAYERLGRLEEARSAYETATRLAPRYIKAQVNAERLQRVSLAGR